MSRLGRKQKPEIIWRGSVISKGDAQLAGLGASLRPFSDTRQTMKNPAQWRGFIEIVDLIYATFLRWLNPKSPSRAVPNNQTAAGTGTSGIFSVEPKVPSKLSTIYLVEDPEKSKSA